MQIKTIHEVLIIGGGFAGVQCARDLAKRKIPNIHIRLLTNKSYLEYYPAIYQVVLGKSPLQSCLPLAQIFRGLNVEIVYDTAINVDLEKKEVQGLSGTRYRGDYIVITLGSQTTYFNIEGLEKLSFNFQSINQAIRLRDHIDAMFVDAHTMEQDELLVALHFVIVGGGPSGVELAGELSEHTRTLARKYKIEESMVTIDIIEGNPRVLPRLSQKSSHLARKRLNSLEVNLLNNRYLVKKGVWSVILKDMELGAKTVVWAAGILTNEFYTKNKQFLFSSQNKICVDDFLQPQSFSDIFVGGDAADTKYSGLAQTAIADGAFIARVIEAKIRNLQSSDKWPRYKTKTPAHVIPIGANWAIAEIAGFVFSGRLAWWLRKLADLRYYISILPFMYAFHIWLDRSDWRDQNPVCRTIAHQTLMSGPDNKVVEITPEP